MGAVNRTEKIYDKLSLLANPTCECCVYSHFEKKHKAGWCYFGINTNTTNVPIVKEFKACDDFQKKEVAPKSQIHILKPAISMELLEKYNLYVEQIQYFIKASTSKYISIGFYLWEMKKYDWYKGGGYDNIYTFGLEVFGWEKTYVHNLIKVCERFSIGSGDHYPSDKLKLEYEGFEFYKLVEMLNMSHEEILEGEITPKWTQKQIREYRQKLRFNFDSVQNSEQTLLPDDNEEDEYIKPVPSKRKEIEIKRFEEFAMPAVLGYIEKHMKDGYTVKIIFEKVD